MSGWILLALLVAVAFGALWLLRVRGAILQFATAALLFGCAGYALQGNPGLAGSARQAAAMEPPVSLAEARHAFFGDFTPNEHWLIMSESFASRGNSEDAVGILKSAVREHPRDSELWIGLGNALVDHAGMLTPAAQYAYTHAAELAPGHPAPLYFLGFALVRSGDRDGAIAAWKEILAEAPADASWRPLVAGSIAALEQPQP